MEYWIEETKFLKEVIRKSEEAKDKIDVGDYAYAKSILDSLIEKAKKRLEEVV
jgi:DNA replication protein DnaD